MRKELGDMEGGEMHLGQNVMYEKRIKQIKIQENYQASIGL